MAGTAVFKMVVSRDSMKNPTATSQGSNRLAVAVNAGSSGSCKCRVYDALRFCDETAQMPVIMETLRVDFVDVFGA